MKLELNLLPLQQWLPTNGEPLIIAGPCGAESREQVMETAKGIAALGKVKVFRSGIWKPRTRPNSFEGVGSIGLSWLREVKKETGLLTTVEVANAQHVEEALKHGIDILWIGARTTVNPFSVQEIADALKGVDTKVMVKNPIHPDIKLWAGALERINQAGIDKLIAVHRGFYSYEKAMYRNLPNWGIPIELKMMCPELPILCDPSHICGRTDILLQVMQKALDMDMAGLMIETHIHPQQALSDAEQQVTPQQLGELLGELVQRKTSSDDPEFENQLQELRNSIDIIDNTLLQALARRMAAVEKIGEYKKDNRVTILQLERWYEILKTRTRNGELMGLNPDFVKGLLQLVHKESIRVQTEIMNNNPASSQPESFT
jgi:chorismate mutase